MTVDPRPRTELVGGEHALRGWSCNACAFRSSHLCLVCPLCTSPVEPRTFSPFGVVWSSTLVHIPVGDIVPPYALVYVDLEDGPRVLAHADPGELPRIGDRVALAGANKRGDIEVVPA